MFCCEAAGLVASMATFQNRLASRRKFACEAPQEFCLSFLPVRKKAAKLRGATFGMH
jgi:hypothetical protein